MLAHVHHLKVAATHILQCVTPGPIRQQSWQFKAVNKYVKAGKQPTSCLGRCTASELMLEQALPT